MKAMKATRSPSFKLLPTLMVAIITAWFAHPAWAGAIAPTLTLTEVSNTQLNWAWDAAGGGTSGTINTLTPDVWGPSSISGPTLGSVSPSGSAHWQEPENTAGFQNLVSFLGPNSSFGGPNWSITVNSDMIATPGAAPDGQTIPFTIFGFQITFVDSAATSETTAVPDTGTTASLLGLSLTGLAFLRRKL
jgi:hypothetical protein